MIIHNLDFLPKYNFEDIIGDHPLIIEAKHIAKKLAASDFPVLIEGETGAGKELFAHAMHYSSQRSNGPFLPVNCCAMSESMLEKELFGFEGEAGLFEAADGGTIFLDEIGDINEQLQARFNRLLQEKMFRRIGGSECIPLNVRIISATNSNLLEKVQNGAFRADLFYRLNVLSIQIPLLKERKSDIPLLTSYFIKQSGKKIRIDQAVIDFLMEYDWHGNVRELKNTIDYMLTVCDGRSIQIHDIPKQSVLSKNKPKKEPEKTDLQLTLMDKREYLFILNTIKDFNDQGEPASRRMIADLSKTAEQTLTTQQVRHRLDFLEKHRYITKGRGRAGTKITLEGTDFLNSLNENLVKD
ncbi:sigma 54-interacting transcriptional regulator [Metabacillus arenae]|uniref:Sigma 54-interacting transcriptional regulator n=1 Tax=Metabacillus arenae TaxID=2771434 RepID=A0A926NIX5_9BACI|nr:sigma 54-interacting transcriptional regulator [Metabacillus arenae]MBD1381600.1 sigma 54-interacting transcriptional regulator [Metabacillus arenae]